MCVRACVRACVRVCQPPRADYALCMYVDDMALVTESRSETQHMVKVLDKACEQ